MTKHWVHKFNLVVFDSVKSTNEEAKKLAFNAVRSNYIAFAKEQTDAKARNGSVWHSNRGNFFASIALHPSFTVESGGELALVASLAVGDGLAEILGVDYSELKFKWPNSIMLNGKKVGSIILETSNTSFKNIPDWFVLGVAVNLMSHPDNTVQPCSSLKDEGFGEIQSETLLNEFMNSFAKRYNIWHNRGFNMMKLEWLDKAFGLNQRFSVRFKDETIEGVFEGIDDNGSLMLRLENGEVKVIKCSEVFFDVSDY